MNFENAILAPFLAFLTISVCGTFAQSRRVLPPESPRAPTPESKSRSVRGSDKDSVTDEATQKYTLIFPSDSKSSDFIDQLNKAGERGYRLTSALYEWQHVSGQYFSFPVAILQLDETQYEYAWFETTSHFFFGVGPFEEKYAVMAKRGFHLFDHFYVGGNCEDLDPDHNPAYGQTCESNYLFLLEREKGVEHPQQFIVAGTAPQKRGVPVVELLTQINEKLSEGFYPTDVLSRAQILLEHTENNDELSLNKPDVKFVTSSSHNDVMKRVNEFAKEGYRLALINDEAAVIYRYSNADSPVSYVSLNTNDQRLEKKLTALQDSGAVYRMIYRDEHSTSYKLIFEQTSLNGTTLREYRVLQFNFEAVKNGTFTRKPTRSAEVRIDLSSSSKETIKLLNNLAKEHFRVRDLFVSDVVSNKVSVLLERDNLKISTQPD